MAALSHRENQNPRNKWTEDNLICDVCHREAWKEFTSVDIVRAVITAAKTLKLQERGIDPGMIGAQ